MPGRVFAFLQSITSEIKTMKTNILTLLTAASLALLGTANLRAGTHVWSGGAGGLNLGWSHPANWSSGGVPAVNETPPVIITFPTNGTPFSVADISNLKVDQINIQRDNLSLGGSGSGKLILRGSTNLSTMTVWADLQVQVQPSLELVLSNQCVIQLFSYEDCYTVPGVGWVCEPYGFPTLTLSNRISGAGALTIGGPGYLELKGALSNTFTGTFIITNDATVFADKPAGGAAVSEVIVASKWASFLGEQPEYHGGSLWLLADNQLSTNALLTVQGRLILTNGADQIVPFLTLDGGYIETGTGKLAVYGDALIKQRDGAPSGGWFESGAPSPTIDGTIDLGSPASPVTRTWTILDDCILDAKIMGGTVATWRKEGAATLYMQRACTYFGSLIIADGLIMAYVPTALGANFNGTTILPNGSLALTNGITSTESFTIDGGTNFPAKRQLSPWSWDTTGWGYLDYGGTLTLNGSVTVFGNVGLTAELAATNTQTFAINGPISGTGSITLLGRATFRFGGTATNTFSGGLLLDDECFLRLSKPAGTVAVPCDIVAGANLTEWAWGSSEIILDAPNQIANTASLALYNNSRLAMGTNDEAVASLELEGGRVTGLSGKLTLAGGGITTLSNWTTARIDVPLILTAWYHPFHVERGTNITDLMLLYPITSSSTAGFRKTGPGILYMSGLNTFTGYAIVDDGTLQLGHSQALGGTGFGTFVSSNAVLQMPGTAVHGEPLTLNGGTLRLIGGTNSWGGPVIINTDYSSVDIVNPTGLLAFTNTVSGAGHWMKEGQGTLALGGTGPNTFNGECAVTEGTLRLQKGAGQVAVSGSALISGPVRGGATVTAVELFGANQIGNACSVYLAPYSTLRMNNYSDVIGSLGGFGNVELGNAQLTLGGNNLSTEFSGTMNGTAGLLIKEGSGTFTLNNTNVFAGPAVVSGGGLTVNGKLNCPVVLNNGSTLTGGGMVGHVSGGGGLVNPGNSAGILKSGNVTFGANHIFRAELNGTVAGVSYDQLQVTGTVNLGGAAFQPKLGFSGGVSNKFVVISNDGTDAITGTFAGLPEGATLTASGAQFKITYKGGVSSNDVVLTQVTVATPPNSTGITKLPNGQMQIGGQGIANMPYSVQANANLNTTNWIIIGATTADAAGKFSFIDTNAPNFPIRFYRFVIP
jgi:autotransporter-associated beta strand protein